MSDTFDIGGGGDGNFGGYGGRGSGFGYGTGGGCITIDLDRNVQTFAPATAQTYGQHATEPPEGMFCEVTFPVLARLDEWTPDGRRLASAGFGVRDLPQSVQMQRVLMPGHDGAIICGSVDEVTIHPDGLVSGKGWLLDDQYGHTAARLRRSGALTGNSINFAAEDVSMEMDPATGKVMKDYTKGKFAGTTLVAIEAIEGATFSIPDDVVVPAADEAVVAAAMAEFALDTAVEFRSVTVKSEHPPADLFANPLLTRPTANVVEELRVFGHLATWGTLHSGVSGAVTPPRSRTDYAYFANGRVLTDAGPVPTGRFVIEGEHAARHFGWREALDHYAATCLAWCDVAIGEDDIGIWYSGMIRPGTKPEAVYAARASALSGDWRRIGVSMELITGLSVNAGAFAVPRASSFSHLGEEVTLLGAGALPMVAADRGNVLALAHDDAETLRYVAGRLAKQEAEEIARSLADED